MFLSLLNFYTTILLITSCSQALSTVMHSISAEKKDIIVSLLHQGLSTRLIAKRCCVSKSTVQHLLQEHSSSIPVPKYGRSEKLSAQQKCLCVRWMTSGALGTATTVTKKLPEDDEIAASRMMVARALYGADLSLAEKKAKPLLSAKNVKVRLEFANKYKDWTIDNWKCVIWSDETRIRHFSSDGRTWY